MMDTSCYFLSHSLDILTQTSEAGAIVKDVRKEMDENVIFAIAFGAFFCVGVLYDQMVLSRYFG